MNFKTTSISFLVLTGCIGLLYYFIGISLWWFILPSVMYLAFIIWGSSNIQSDFFIKALCKSNTEKKQIAITFDDGPNREFTPKILSVLDEYNVKATFFVIGKNNIGNESLLKQIDAKGHIIGNHTFSHSFFIDFESVKGFKEELNKTSDLVFNVIGKKMKLFRPPYGVTTPNLAKAARELDYTVIGWNVRSMDTTNDAEKKIIERVTQQLKPGAIVLFHDTSENTIQVLKQTLSFAKQNGLTIVSLGQLLNIEPYE